MQVVIMATNYGKRLMPLTKDKPKIMVKVLGTQFEGKVGNFQTKYNTQHIINSKHEDLLPSELNRFNGRFVRVTIEEIDPLW